MKHAAAGLKYGACAFFGWYAAVMALVLVTGAGNAGIWVVFAPLWGIAGCIFGYTRSKLEKNTATDDPFD